MERASERPDGKLAGQTKLEQYSDQETILATCPTIRQDSLDLDHVDVWRIERAGS